MWDKFERSEKNVKDPKNEEKKDLMTTGRIHFIYVHLFETFLLKFEKMNLKFHVKKVSLDLYVQLASQQAVMIS